MDPQCSAFQQCSDFQRMPAATMTLLKSTTPYLDAYLAFDLEAELQLAGFSNVQQRPCSARQRLVTASVAV